MVWTGRRLCPQRIRNETHTRPHAHAHARAHTHTHTHAHAHKHTVLKAISPGRIRGAEPGLGGRGGKCSQHSFPRLISKRQQAGLAQAPKPWRARTTEPANLNLSQMRIVVRILFRKHAGGKYDKHHPSQMLLERLARGCGVRQVLQALSGSCNDKWALTVDIFYVLTSRW